MNVSPKKSDKNQRPSNSLEEFTINYTEEKQHHTAVLSPGSPLFDRSSSEVVSGVPGKIKILRNLKKHCLIQAKAYTDQHKRMSASDSTVDVLNALLQSSSVSLTVLGITYPGLLLYSAITGGAGFVLGRIQDKLNLKAHYTRYSITTRQYSDLARQIVAVLAKNGMTVDEYTSYIAEVSDRISLIEDSSLLI